MSLAITPLSLCLQDDQNLKTVNTIVRSHAVSMSAGEVEEDGLKVESEEGVVGIGMGAQ